jgi:hypothetical protein
MILNQMKGFFCVMGGGGGICVFGELKTEISKNVRNSRKFRTSKYSTHLENEAKSLSSEDLVLFEV